MKENVEGRGSRVEDCQSHVPLFPDTRRAFTLIELLVVIAIIGVLAAFIIPGSVLVHRHSVINHVQAELAQLETAIERYHAAYGFYPPDNQGYANPLTNQLYFELTGTTNFNPVTQTFQTLDGAFQVNSNQLAAAFGAGVSGFMNCSKPGNEESRAAQSFLPEPKPNQVALFNPPNSVKLLVTSVGGPLQAYQPIPSLPDANPWRYVSSNPTNNPGSYDLWIQIVFTPGQTNLICNWKKTPQLNSPLP